MATNETSGFFNALNVSGKYDREYDASQFAEYFSKFISDGVFINPMNQLQVIAKTGLTVTVKAGSAYIEGYWYTLHEDADITLSPNTLSYASNSVICCRLSKTSRTITLQKKESVSSTLPTNDGTIHELVLCVITMNPAVSTITNAMIEDKRSDNRYCGFVKGLVEQIDTTDIFLQLETSFENWFNTIKGKLSTDVAGSLQTQIDNISNNMTTIRYGTTAPNNSVGKNGDVYIQIVQ